MIVGLPVARISTEGLKMEEGRLNCLPDEVLINRVAQTQWQLYAPEVERRATRLVLTLLAFKHKHGETPKRLQELVEGKMIVGIPAIAFTGDNDFRFLPNGLKEPVHLKMSWCPTPGEHDSVSWEIPANTPLLSVSPYGLPGTAYSVELLPADMEKYPELKRYLEEGAVAPGMGILGMMGMGDDMGMGGGMGMDGGPGMDAGMGMGSGMDGGMGMGMEGGMGGGRPGPVAMEGGMGMGMEGGPGMGGGMESPPMPGVGVPEWNPPRKDPLPPFLRRLIELEIKWTAHQALVIPLGPVKVIEQEGEVETR